MRIAEIQPTKSVKPQTPDEQRIANLKAAADRAKSAVTAERARQQQRKSQQTLAKVQQQLKQAAA
jgi:nicotinic acid mononucleotide adenylyltransferase